MKFFPLTACAVAVCLGCIGFAATTAIAQESTLSTPDQRTAHFSKAALHGPDQRTAPAAITLESIPGIGVTAPDQRTAHATKALLHGPDQRTAPDPNAAPVAAVAASVPLVPTDDGLSTLPIVLISVGGALALAGAGYAAMRVMQHGTASL
jgi:hypothetical protein